MATKVTHISNKKWTEMTMTMIVILCDHDYDETTITVLSYPPTQKTQKIHHSVKKKKGGGGSYVVGNDGKAEG